MDEDTAQVLDRLLAKAEELRKGNYACSARFRRLKEAIEAEQVALAMKED